MIALLISANVAEAKKKKWYKKAGKIVAAVAIGAVTGGAGAAVLGASIASGAAAGAITSGIATAKSGKTTVGFDSKTYEKVDGHINSGPKTFENPSRGHEHHESQGEGMGKIDLKKIKEIFETKFNKMSDKEKENVLKNKNQIHKEYEKQLVLNNFMFKSNTNPDHKSFEECVDGAKKAYKYNSIITNIIVPITPKKIYKKNIKKYSDIDDEVFKEQKEECGKIYSREP